MPGPNMAIGIIADDQTARGISSAKRHLAKLGADQNRASMKLNGQMEAAATRSSLVAARSSGLASRSMAKSFGTVERASARVLSTSSGLADRISAIGDISRVMGNGLGEAAARGSLLAGSMSLLGSTAVIAAGGIAGVAAATDFLMRKWSSNIAGASRFAEAMGLSTQSLQAFQSAAALQGIDKNAAGSAIGSLSSTLNDAAYGRNTSAIAAMAAAGIKMKRGSDGTVDVQGMLPGIADAIARQNSSGRRTLAAALGIPIEALPAFSQGGSALMRDEAFGNRYGAVSDAGQIARARSWQRRRAMVDQMFDRGANDIGSRTAGKFSGLLDAGVSAGRSIIAKGGHLDPEKTLGALTAAISNSLIPPATRINDGGRKIEHGSDLFGRAVDRLTDGINWIDKHWLGGTGGAPTRLAPAGRAAFDGSFSGMISKLEGSRDGQISPRGAVGAMQVMPGTLRSPGLGVRPAQDNSFAEINRVGTDYANALLAHYGGDEVLAAEAYNFGYPRVDRLISRYGNPAKREISEDAFRAHLPAETRDYGRRAEALMAGGSGTPSMDTLQRAAAAEGMKVVIEVHSHVPVKVKAHTSKGAISYASVGRNN